MPNRCSNLKRPSMTELAGKYCPRCRTRIPDDELQRLEFEGEIECPHCEERITRKREPFEKFEE